MNVEESLDQFVSSLRGRSAPRTVSAYELSLRKFAPYWRRAGGRFDDSILIGARRFRRAMEEAGDAPKSVALRLTAVRTLARWLHRRGLLGVDLAPEIPVPKERIRKRPSADEPRLVAKLLDKYDQIESARDRLLLKLLLGSRLEHVRTLAWEDVDLRRRQLRIRRIGQSIAITEATAALFREYRGTTRNPRGPLFVGRGGRAISISSLRKAVYDSTERILGQRLSPDQLVRGSLRVV